MSCFARQLLASQGWSKHEIPPSSADRLGVQMVSYRKKNLDKEFQWRDERVGVILPEKPSLQLRYLCWSLRNKGGKPLQSFLPLLRRGYGT